jgi:hypothetical protein
LLLLLLLQVVFGIARPGLTHKRRQNWRKGHTIMGWLAVTAGMYKLKPLILGHEGGGGMGHTP